MESGERKMKEINELLAVINVRVTKEEKTLLEAVGEKNGIEAVEEIIEKHLMTNKPIKELLFNEARVNEIAESIVTYAGLRNEPLDECLQENNFADLTDAEFNAGVREIESNREKWENLYHEMRLN